VSDFLLDWFLCEIKPRLLTNTTCFPAVIITVLNAYSGFALVAEGFMLDNPLLTTVGALIGVSGSILSYIMVCSQDFKGNGRVLIAGWVIQCVAMNRTLSNVLFGGISSEAASDYKIEGTVTQIAIDETADALANADSVILVRRSCSMQRAVVLTMVYRWSATGWPSRGPNIRSQRSSRCSEPRERT